MGEGEGEEALISAVFSLKEGNPKASAKDLLQLLSEDPQWTDLSLSAVKKACSKAVKARGARFSQSAPDPSLLQAARSQAKLPTQPPTPKPEKPTPAPTSDKPIVATQPTGAVASLATAPPVSTVW